MGPKNTAANRALTMSYLLLVRQQSGWNRSILKGGFWGSTEMHTFGEKDEVN